MSSERLHGNWLRPQKLTIRGVGWPTAVTAMVGYLGGLIALQSDPRWGTAILSACAAITAVSATRIGGATLMQWCAAKTRWQWASARGTTSFRALSPSGWRLPAQMAHTQMVVVQRAGRTYGAVHDPRPRRLAVTLRVEATAGDLSDPAEHDAAVGRWERWLEALGRRPDVAWVSVTVETAPSSGDALRASVARRLAPGAPADCRALMTTLASASPAVAAHTETRVTVTFDLRAWDAEIGRRGRRRGVAGYLPVLDRAARSLAASLDGCGVTVRGLMSAQHLAGALRVAFDPASAGAVELALLLGRNDIPDWEYAGPMRAVESREDYRHDSGASASFVWAQAPRQLVASTVLDALTRPGGHRKRVTSTYVATPAARVMDAATAQVRWRWLAQMVAHLPVIGRAGTAQDDRDAAAAEQATREVAAGAGWIAQTITATVTALDPADLPAAIAELEHAAGTSHLRLRRLTELQAAGFVAGLPAGLSLTELARRWSR